MFRNFKTRLTTLLESFVAAEGAGAIDGLCACLEEEKAAQKEDFGPLEDYFAQYANNNGGGGGGGDSSMTQKSALSDDVICGNALTTKLNIDFSRTEKTVQSVSLIINLDLTLLTHVSSLGKLMRRLIGGD